MPKCGSVCEVYSRVCGYHRPVTSWNQGTRAEFRERREYKAVAGDHGKARPPRVEMVGRSAVGAQAAD
jgi:hypothetical protein